MFEFSSQKIIILSILVVLGALTLMAMSAPYFYYLVNGDGAVVNVILFILSIGVLFVVGAIGIAAALLQKLPLLLWFCLVTLLVCIFTLIQTILTAIASPRCNDESSPLFFLCADLMWLLFTHSALVIVVSGFCSVTSYLLRRQITLENEDQDYFY
mmetsp:Transcript_14165/g.36153  ORF Transcript_14165/g.36153 Transcript_14165/m.36153 type:complete len:156 (+) Transcript_14165:317-784(+)